MPEVEPEKNLEPHKQCEIRRPSPAREVEINGLLVHFAEGYFFDIVWVKQELGKVGTLLVDPRGRTWTVAAVFGTKPMSRGRVGLKKADTEPMWGPG